MRSKNLIAILLVLTASILPDLIFTSAKIQYIKILVLGAAAIAFFMMKSHRELCKLTIILIAINASYLLMDVIRNTELWKELFLDASLYANIKSTVALKMIGILPVLITLQFLLKTSDKFYLKVGNLSAKAAAIPWLGITDGKISWGKLSMISGFLVAFGTILLTMLTSTGFQVSNRLIAILPYIPIILLLAFANSFCEGIIYRNAVMGPLKQHFHKSFVVMMSALFFGIAHYQGIPGGILGAVMSGVLGWFMARSMYETQGFASAWMIHFMQDVTIFATLFILGK